MAKSKGKTNGNGATLGFEAKLWLTADKLRNNMDAAEYKHVVLGLIFLDRKSTRLNSSHTEIYTLSLHDALPILRRWALRPNSGSQPTSCATTWTQQSISMSSSASSF